MIIRPPVQVYSIYRTAVAGKEKPIYSLPNRQNPQYVMSPVNRSHQLIPGAFVLPDAPKKDNNHQSIIINQRQGPQAGEELELILSTKHDISGDTRYKNSQDALKTRSWLKNKYPLGESNPCLQDENLIS